MLDIATIVFVLQDQPALALIQELSQKYGIRVPEDISVIGYNNIRLIRDLDIPLTTVEDPMELVIRSAVTVCVSKVRKTEEKEIRIRRPLLIERESVRDNP